MRFLVLVLIVAASLPAADFTFGTILRAGLSGNGDWEMTSGTSSSDTSQPKIDASPYYTDNGWKAFEIGFTGTAGFIRIYNGASTSGPSLTSSFVAGSPLAANATWTLNSFLRATGNAALILKPETEIAIRDLTLGSGLTVLTPVASTSYSASQTGLAPSEQTNIAPISFRSNNANGAWLISGDIRFDGLSTYTLFGASGSQLQFGLTASAVEPAAGVPEPATFLTCAGVLIFLGCFRRKRLPRQ